MHAKSKYMRIDLAAEGHYSQLLRSENGSAPHGINA